MELDPETHRRPRKVAADYLLSASDRPDLLVKREAVVAATGPIVPERFSKQFQRD
jgi:hypothetical protein